MGVHYSGEEGHFYEKIHAGTVCIYMAFMLFIFFVKNSEKWFLDNKAAFLLLAVYLAVFLYMALRSGFAGLAVFLDTHIPIALVAVMVRYHSLTGSRWTLNLFIFCAIINAITGIIEAIYQVRLFEFDPDWVVLHEEYFRASAFIGHPLNNAIFTVIALFILLALDYKPITKMLMGTILFASLFAFGGRFALLFTILALMFLTAHYILKAINNRNSTQLLFISLLIIVAGGAGAILLYFIIFNGFGERIFAHHLFDKSANARWISFMAFHYMSREEIFLGVSADKILGIVMRINQHYEMSDIENPFIIIMMYMGLCMFGLWLVATLYFIKSLLNHASLLLKITVISYFLIASTSNSFGRKDANYMIMVAMVLCAKNLKAREKA